MVVVVVVAVCRWCVWPVKWTDGWMAKERIRGRRRRRGDEGKSRNSNGCGGMGMLPSIFVPGGAHHRVAGSLGGREEALGGRRGHYGVLPAGARTKARTPSH